MNSKQAKEIKTQWKNIIKPQLRENIKATREIYNKNILIIERGRNDEQDFSRLVMKEQKLLLFVMTYLYNQDYDNAVKYVIKHKEFAYEFIEQLEKMSKDNYRLGLDNSFTNEGVPQHEESTEGEGTFIKLCKTVKEDIEYNEKCLEVLSVVICEVRDIRKADKRMRKRKNKR